MQRILFAGVVLASIAVPAALQAQTPRRQAPIEIRGQVPTPQVVTVRPREVPAYSRQVLVPNFYDHDFWPSILPGYQIVQQRMLTGRLPGDTTGAARTAPAGMPAAGDTTRVPPAGSTPPAGTTPPAGSTPPASTTPPAGSTPPAGTTPPAGSTPPAGGTASDATAQTSRSGTAPALSRR